MDKGASSVAGRGSIQACFATRPGASENYKEVTQCLRAQCAPEGNQLECQAKFQ